MLRIKLIYPDGTAHSHDVHEAVIEYPSVIIFVRDGQVVIKEDDSDQK